MKQKKDDDRIIYQSLAMIMQFGLHMIVPICMMSALGIWLDSRLGTSFWTILLFLAGAAAGGQNIYRTVKNMCGDGRSDEAEKTGKDKRGSGSAAGGKEDRNG